MVTLPNHHIAWIGPKSFGASINDAGHMLACTGQGHETHTDNLRAALLNNENPEDIIPNLLDIIVCDKGFRSQALTGQFVLGQYKRVRGQEELFEHQAEFNEVFPSETFPNH